MSVAHQPELSTLGQHATQYATQGLEVFPVNPADKTPLVSQYKATTDPDTITAWWTQRPTALIGHRVNPHTIILDVDPRHGGAGTWMALQAAAQIPPTRTHQSGRGDGGGHTWWIRPGNKLSVTKLDAWAKEHGTGHDAGAGRWTCGVDILQHDHRYTILPPSPHPVNAKPYYWKNNRTLDLQPQPLPQLLVDLLTDDTPPPTPRPAHPPDPDSTLDWYSSHTTWAGLLQHHQWVLVGGDGNTDGSRWRHPTASSAFSATIRHNCLFVYSTSTGFEPTVPGTPHGYTPAGAYAILEHHGDLKAAARTARRLKDGTGTHTDDLAALVGSHNATRRTTQPPNATADDSGVTIAANLPDTFWDARTTLTAIRQAAWSRSRSADAVLAAVLARAICTVTPDTALPPIVGSRASLNLAIALVSPSGAGKSTAKAIATELIDLQTRTDITDDLPIGSGEGLIDAYFEWVTEDDGTGKTHKVKRQTKTAVFAYLDEGQALSTMGSRQGSTLLPTLRSAWSGSTLGQANATEERKRVLPAHTYRMGIVVGFQPEHAVTLIDDAAGGTPQRFVYLSAVDPNIPDQPPNWPTLNWTPPASSTLATDINVPDNIQTEIRTASLAAARGDTTTDPLDSHHHLSQLKIAAALAILEQRTNITGEDWKLASMVLETSRAVRADIINRARRQAHERETAVTAKVVRQDLARHGAVTNNTIERVARTIARHVQKMSGVDGHGTCTVRCIRNSIASRDRSELAKDCAEPIAVAEAQGWILSVTDGTFKKGQNAP